MPDAKSTTARIQYPRPVCLIILDGFGVESPGTNSAISVAVTPNLDSYQANYSHTTLGAAGADVGLPDGQMGNSEVGHLNLGAGRIVFQDLTRINNSILDGSFFDNRVLITAIEEAKKNKSALHLMGLVSDGGVHSQDTHIYALLELAKKQGVQDVYVHCFLDGRDTPPKSALKYIKELEAKMQSIGIGKIAMVSGRYYAMDRDKRWERTKLAYDALVFGKGEERISAKDSIERSYKALNNDEFVKPAIIAGVDGRIKDGDSVVFFNFRSDRARQLTEALTQSNFDGFDRATRPPRIFFVSLTLYDVNFDLPVAFAPVALDNTLDQVLEAHSRRQAHIAETEKYAHVTFFLNGGVEEPVAGEDRILVQSPKVATYDLSPEMSAREVADKAVSAVETGKYDFIVINFANCDMVGHTGIITAVVKAIEVIDAAVGDVVQAVKERGGATIITADHGNAEQMVDDDGKPRTAHTSNRVPLVVIGDSSMKLKEGGRLADVAPTVLGLMGIPAPPEMDGKNLLTRT